jgi:hypothetical protein
LAAAATIFVLCLSNLVVGEYLGFHSIAAYLWFWLFCTLIIVSSRRVITCLYPETDCVSTVIRMAVVGFALIVSCGLILGALGLLTPAWYLVGQTLLLVASLFLKRTRSATGSLEIPLVVAAVIVPMTALIVGFGITHGPQTLYDSLSYHLLFPARWLLEHRLSIIPTPFSDEAQAYQPANGELFFLWLMLPFHGDLIARFGQFPFLLLIGVTLYAIARRIGARPEHAVYAGVFCFLSRPIVDQAVGADVDLVCAATFLTSLYLGIVAVDTNERRDWALWGISLGLYWGSKYLAIVYTPVFLLLALMGRTRMKALWALPGVIAFALPWYLRNWLAAGSPIYPASLKIAGVTIAQGAYTREAMMHSVFHTTDLRLFPVMAAHAFGTPLFLVWIPFGLIGAASIVTRQAAWPGRYVLSSLLLMIPLHWFGVPDNVDSRFLLPAAAAATVLLAFPFGTRKTWNGFVHGLYGAAIVWILIGMNAELRAEVPWYMGGWLTLEGLVSRGFLAAFFAISLVAAWGWYVAARKMHRFLLPMLAIASIAGVAVVIGSETSCAPFRCDFLQVSSPFIRSTMFYAWSWVRDNAHGATFAYTGNNLPYPLFGEQLTNRVYYVNLDHHSSWRFHDYDRAHRKHPGNVPSTPLARSSGVLMAALEFDGSWSGTARPRYERMDGNREAWTGNLKALGVDHLFVSVLSAYEIDYLWHDAEGFPIEQQWAQARPDEFSLVYENPQVRIYTVRLH